MVVTHPSGVPEEYGGVVGVEEGVGGPVRDHGPQGLPPCSWLQGRASYLRTYTQTHKYNISVIHCNCQQSQTQTCSPLPAHSHKVNTNSTVTFTLNLYYLKAKPSPCLLRYNSGFQLKCCSTLVYRKKLLLVFYFEIKINLK